MQKHTNGNSGVVSWNSSLVQIFACEFGGIGEKNMYQSKSSEK